MSEVITFDTPPFDKLAFTIVSLVGEEAISELFDFDILVVVDATAFRAATSSRIETALLMQAVAFEFGIHPFKRRGIVAAVQVERVPKTAVHGELQLRLRVVPLAWKLTQRVNSRVFEPGMYVHQIVTTVLKDSGVKSRWNLGKWYPRRQFCMQYRETDYDFVKRILAEEGIFFYFEASEDFAGGEPPVIEAPEASTADDVAKVFDTIGKVADIIPQDHIKFGGAVAKVLGDVIKDPAKDPEADDIINTIGAGQAGPGGPGDVFVFTDSAAAYGISPPQYVSNTRLSLHATEEANLDGPDLVQDFTPVRQTAVERVELRDYDYRRPMLLLQSRVNIHGAPDADASLEAYAHHGEYEKPDVDDEMAGVHLEQHRAPSETAHGAARSASLKAGFVFQIDQTDRPGTRDGDYAVTWIRHRYTDKRFESSGDQQSYVRRLFHGWFKAVTRALHERPDFNDHKLLGIGGLGSPTFESYENVFRCVEAQIAFRPPRPLRTMHHVSETATVVGPRKSEIHTDGRGRIKVRFHWDRFTKDGKEVWDDTRSCWIRVVQPWAGAGYGFQFFPRVGMEVLVSFVAGDPDRPIVVGSVYNATHPIPDPAWVTRSGIRTQTTPDGGGFNELSFDDRKGNERVFVHAQKDLDEVVNDTHFLNVKNNQTVLVSEQQEVAVGAQLVAVRDNQITLVGDSQGVVVRGNRSARVMSNEMSLVDGNAFAAVQGMSVRTNQRDELTTVYGDRNLTVNGDAITQVNGRGEGQNANAVTFVQGSSHLNAVDRITLRALTPNQATSNVRLECGLSSVEVRGDGIALSGDTIRLEGNKTIQLVVGGTQVTLTESGVSIQAKSIKLTTEDGSEMKLDGKVAQMYGTDKACLLGKEVYLDTGPQAVNALNTAATASPEMAQLCLQFTHREQELGKTAYIAGALYRLLADDYRAEGHTDPKGILEQLVPKNAKTATVTLWPKQEDVAALGTSMQWLIDLEEHAKVQLPSNTSLDGARLRLRNLGYQPGTMGDKELDDATLRAMNEFKRDNPAPPHTIDDVPYIAELKRIYGE